MSSSLTTTPTDNSSTQTATQDPQVAGQPTTLQPTNSTASLTTSTTTSGVTLHPQSAPTIALSAATVSTQPPAPVKGHANAGLVTIAILLFIVAVVLFASTTMSAKNTTK